jgi:hypothetical protein
MQRNHRSTYVLLAILVVAVVPLVALAANNRSKCKNNLKQLGIALHAYHEIHGAWPTDVCDDQGRALLSWRVRVLPYAEEEPLLKELRLSQPWDSEHNRRFVEKMPRVFACPSSQAKWGMTTYVRLLGVERLLLVEADDAHAVVWSKPGDLPYNAESPSAGLSSRHGADSLARGGGFVVFLDGQIRFVPANIRPDVLRAFLTSNGDGRTLDLPWYRAIKTDPICYVMWPWLLITVCGAIGVARGLPRLLRCLPISPGEMLWLAAGASQVTHFVAVLTCYRFETLATFGSDQWFPFWLLPSAAATLVTIVATLFYSTLPVWRNLFIGAVILFLLRTLDATQPHQHRSPDESFITSSAPVLLALLAIATALVTHSGRESSVWRERQAAHWTGIVVCLVPFIFFVICVAYGFTYPRDMFGRVRD